jgi:hypothetical protein
MAKLNLSLAVGPYDRTRALIDGSVQIDGVTVAGMTLSPEEIFFRAFRQAEFDICELSLSSFTLKTAQGNCPYVGAHIDRGVAEGAIDGFIAPRPPSLPKGTPHVGWLFADPVAAAKDYYKRTGIFPIMHLVGVRRELVERNPWLPGAVFKAFEQAKKAALDLLSDTSATKVTLPFVEERLIEARALMGEDFWSYGLEPNRKTLESFLKHHHAQGLSPRLVKPEELFHPGTLESFKL